jgi:hypothetical protein
MLWWLNLFRQFRNPDETGTSFPAQAEYFHIYQNLERDYTSDQYPVADPGDPEGANLANVINQFVFGNPFMFGEDGRITDPAVPLWLGIQPPSTPKEKWLVGQLQRGAYNKQVGIGNTPALSAAIDAFFIATPYSSLHGKSFGSFQPAPVILLEDCGPDEDDGKNIRSYEIKFTALRKDVSTSGFHGTHTVNSEGFPQVIYDGSCPSFAFFTDVNHVWGLFRAPTAYYVFVNPGFWDIYPAEDWIEGPYDGNGRLYRPDGGQISRALWAYVSEKWRGTDEQRNPDTYKIKDIAFDNQAFHTGQFPLSPARGEISGDSIEAIYPTASFSGSHITANTILNWTPSNIAGKYHRFDGYVFAGLFYEATNLVGQCTVDILDDTGKVLQSLAIGPDGDGNASDVIWLPDASSSTFIQARVTSGATFKGNGTISIEVAELVEYQANFWDTYLAIRLMSTEGGDDLDLDTIDGDSARGTANAISDTFKRWGMIYNPSTDGVRTIRSAINTNPVYDSIRKVSREMVKIIRRDEYLSYAVENGKTVIRFKRWAYGLFNSKADIGWGMAPSFEPSVEIIESEEYVVRATSGFVTYRGQKFIHGQRFIGVAGHADFQTSGDAQPFVYDGIKSVARKKGYTNEWCGFISTHVEHPSISSIWKLDAYADYFPFIDRCHFYSFSTPTELFRHINVNYVVNLDARTDGTGYDIQNKGILLGDLLVSPESVTGYRYALGANASGISDDFCKSCQVYQAPYEVESCVIEPDMVSGGRNDVIKVTFKTRFQYDEVNAPASVNADVSTWGSTEKVNLRTLETYRTDDNALREYSRLIADGTHGSWKIGDSASFSNVQSLPDNPFGCIVPHFYFCKLVPKPYEDGNDSYDSTDSRLTIDPLRIAEVWIRAMCEGYINGFSEKATVCADLTLNKPYDYSFEALCFAAFNGKNIGAFGLSARKDNPAGHGPLPNTIAYADVFNRISEATNLLKKVRLEFPLQIEFKVKSEESLVTVASGCLEGAGNHFQLPGACPNHGSSTESGWLPGSLGSAQAGMALGNVGTYCDGSGGFVLSTASEKISYRYSPIAAFQYAISPEITGLIQGGNISIYGAVTKDSARPFATSVSVGGETCLTSAVWFPGTVYGYVNTHEDLGCVDLVEEGLDSGLPECGDLYFGTQADPSSPPDSSCANASSVDIGFSLIADNGVSTINVPIVSPDP